MFGFMLNSALSAMNWAFYFNHPSPWSMFAGIFCGAGALFCLAIEVADR